MISNFFSRASQNHVYSISNDEMEDTNITVLATSSRTLGLYYLSKSEMIEKLSKVFPSALSSWRRLTSTKFNTLDIKNALWTEIVVNDRKSGSLTLPDFVNKEYQMRVALLRHLFPNFKPKIDVRRQLEYIIWNADVVVQNPLGMPTNGLVETNFTLHHHNQSLQIPYFGIQLEATMDSWDAAISEFDTFKRECGDAVVLCHGTVASDAISVAAGVNMTTRSGDFGPGFYCFRDFLCALNWAFDRSLVEESALSSSPNAAIICFAIERSVWDTIQKIRANDVSIKQWTIEAQNEWNMYCPSLEYAEELDDWGRFVKFCRKYDFSPMNLDVISGTLHDCRNTEAKPVKDSDLDEQYCFVVQNFAQKTLLTKAKKAIWEFHCTQQHLNKVI